MQEEGSRAPAAFAVRWRRCGGNALDHPEGTAPAPETLRSRCRLRHKRPFNSMDSRALSAAWACGVGAGLAAALLLIDARQRRRQQRRCLGSEAWPGAPGAGTPAAAAEAPRRRLADITPDAPHPEALYMPTASLSQLADCWLLVDGVCLPAHSQVLAAQAGVLRGLVLAAREGSLGPAQASCSGQGAPRSVRPLPWRRASPGWHPAATTPRCRPP